MISESKTQSKIALIFYTESKLQIIKYQNLMPDIFYEFFRQDLQDLQEGQDKQIKFGQNRSEAENDFLEQPIG
jgi:hypothetical protein